MSDMIINDSVPVDKKWSELIKYNIFIMKLVEFAVALLLMIVPFIVRDISVVHCMAVAPTLILSTMFVVLYLVDQVHDLAEQLYLTVQIVTNSLAFLFAFVGHTSSGALYGLFYIHLIIALAIDLYYIIRERSYALTRKD